MRQLLVSCSKGRAMQFLLTCIFLFFFTFTHAQDVFVGLTSNGGLQGKGTAFSIDSAGGSFNIIKAFEDWGQTPNKDLVLGSDGNFYGMTPKGGTYGYGTIFKMTPTGTLTVLHQFNATPDGGYPYGSLIKGLDGNLYGLTSVGGTGNYGTIFKVSLSGTYTVVKSFVLSTMGGRPQGRLVLAKDSCFYGITQGGGTFGYGTIFKITSSGTYTVLRHLNTADGTYSVGSLTQGKDGSLYGMTNRGGTYGFGTIFKITTTGTFTVLRNLNDPDGKYPEGTDLIQATDGNFYGMTSSGGVSGGGTLFRITPTGTFTVIKAFLASSSGSYPYGSLIQHSDGYLYGMLSRGSSLGFGTIFKSSLDGTTFTVLRSLNGTTDGAYPKGGFVKDNSGVLYGMTAGTTSNNSFGTIFKITTSGTFTLLKSFNGSTSGNAPLGTLIQGSDNAFYGTTSSGGAYNYGTVFKICSGTVTNLHSFSRYTDGGVPKGRLIQAKDGYYYGMTSEGGTYGYGTIFKISSSGSFIVIRHLQGADGTYPQGSLIQGQGTDSSFYGMTSAGGGKSAGTIFKLKPSGAFTVLYNFQNTFDGGTPKGDLVQYTDGVLYGLNSSRVFKITTAGQFDTLHTFKSNAEGGNPFGSLVIGNDGNFYGTTSNGATYNYGTIFKVTPTGKLTVLKQLQASSDGGTPKGSLVKGSGGNFYGLTTTGGVNNGGTIFKITPTGTYKVIRHLDLLKDGGAPYGSLLLQKNMKLIANPQSVTTGEDTAKVITLTGSGGSPLTFTISTAPKNGTLSGSGATRTYTPKANYNGKDSFYFTSNVGCYASAPAKVVITVTPVNDAPVLAPIGNKTVVIGNTLTFTATATDVDAGQTKTFSLISTPSGATINATSGVFSWKPAATGSYTFKVRVTDNGSPVLYNEEQITVTVSAAAAINPTPTTDWEGLLKSFMATIYPNPVLDKLMLSLNDYVNYALVTIVDSRGVVMGTYKFEGTGRNAFEIQATQLRPGFYLIQIQTDKGTKTMKFLKW